MEVLHYFSDFFDFVYLYKNIFRSFDNVSDLTLQLLRSVAHFLFNLFAL